MAAGILGTFVLNIGGFFLNDAAKLSDHEPATSVSGPRSTRIGSFDIVPGAPIR